MTRTTEIAPGLAVAAQLDPRDVAALAARGVRTIVNNRPDGEEAGQPAAAAVRAAAEKLGLTYVHLPFTSATATAADAAAFEKAVGESPKPIVAHCRTGTRTYLMWAATQVLNRGADAAGLVAEAAAKGYDIASLPALAARLKRAG